MSLDPERTVTLSAVPFRSPHPIHRVAGLTADSILVVAGCHILAFDHATGALTGLDSLHASAWSKPSTPHLRTLRCAASSRDGRFLAVADLRSRVVVFDRERRYASLEFDPLAAPDAPPRKPGDPRPPEPDLDLAALDRIDAVAISGDGLRVASHVFGEDTVRVWSLDRSLTVLPGHAPLAFSADGRFLFAGSVVHDLDVGESFEVSVGDSPVSAAAFDARATELLVATADGGFGVVDLVTLTTTYFREHVARAALTTVAFVDDASGARAVVGANPLELVVLDAHDGRPRLSRSLSDLREVHLDGASGSLVGVNLLQRRLLALDALTGEPRHTDPHHTGSVHAVAATDSLAASGGDDAEVHLYDLGSSSLTARLLAPGAVDALAFEDDGARLSASGLDAHDERWSCTWDTRTHEVVTRGSRAPLDVSSRFHAAFGSASLAYVAADFMGAGLYHFASDHPEGVRVRPSRLRIIGVSPEHRVALIAALEETSVGLVDGTTGASLGGVFYGEAAGKHRSLPHERALTAALSPDGRGVVLGTERGRVVYAVFTEPLGDPLSR
ncbi:MAG: WD40 repeat domain-containing protein [Polyangiaceae bacterium]